jgi:hypothetical protein
MKSTMARMVLILCALASPAFADDTPQIKFARGWMQAMLAPGGAIAAPSKDRPLPYFVNVETKSCKKLKSGTATDGKAATQLKKCITDTYKLIGKAPESLFVMYPTPKDLYVEFPMQLAGKIKPVLEGAKVAQAQYLGLQHNLNVYFVFAPDDKLRAVLVTEEMMSDG